MTVKSTNVDPRYKTVTAKVRLDHYRFPKGAHNSGDYAIVFCNVKEIVSGEIPDMAYYGNGSICITGSMPKLEFGMDYLFQGVLNIDPKWGAQYSVVVMRLAYDLTTEENQKKFFSFFLTPKQIDNLFKAYSSPVKLLADKDIEALTTIKGIGQITAQRLCMKYEENVENGRAYIELQDLGLTKNALDKLIEEFGSPDVVVDLIKENPYRLITLVRGYGWTKADAIAQRQGFATNCPERVTAFVQYFLYQKSVEGHSCYDADELVAATVAECQPITTDEVVNIISQHMINEEDFPRIYKQVKKGNKDIEEPDFFYSIEKHQLGLFYLRVIEEKIKEELVRLKNGESSTQYDKETCDKIIHEVEERNGFTYTIEQQRAIANVLSSNVSIITGSAGCVDCDTEYFNGYKWKKISRYKKGEKVLMYKEDGTAELVVPSDYVKYPAESLWLTKGKYGVNMCLSDEHNVYYETSKGHLTHKSFAQVKEMHENSKYGFSGRFITSFKAGRKGINLSDAEIKVMLAVIADGSFTHAKDSKLCRFHVKKDRKKKELRKIFIEAGLKWREKESAKEGYTDFYIYAPRRERVFKNYWYRCSQKQLQLICENVTFWDGSKIGKRQGFFSCSKQSAEFIQYAFSACGYRASLKVYDRRGGLHTTNGVNYIRQKKEYSVSITKRNLIGITGNGTIKTPIVPYKTKDGFKYCFTVPTHMWVMRRGGNIMVTGNTGKSSTLSPLIEIFNHYHQNVAQCALSGRAASLLTEYTGLNGKTIHRLLKYVPETGRFQHDKNEPLGYDIIVLDETSMVGEELFLSLISAIKTGSKLIMLGDTKQLPPINVGNILHDMITSGYITTNTLTVIQRQAQKSGIISQSLQVCAGKSLCKNEFSGEEIRGELKDFKIICNSEAGIVHTKALEEYRKLYEKGVDPDDIEVVVPVRTRGMNSCRFFNAEIQNMVNGDEKGEKKSIDVTYTDNNTKYTVTYRENDKIMVIRNNYHARTVKGKEVAIFNGNMGHIVDIYNDSMIIKLCREEDDSDLIILPRNEWGDLTHAWATTCHRCQGSQFKYIIIALDNSSYPLLMREWLYTALTRARKYCVLVGQPSAINMATRTSNIKVKQTWLKDELYKVVLEDAGVKK